MCRNRYRIDPLLCKFLCQHFFKGTMPECLNSDICIISISDLLNFVRIQTNNYCSMCYLASFTVISAKATSSMLQLTFSGSLQIQYPVFWIMLVIMVTTAIAQVK